MPPNEDHIALNQVTANRRIHDREKSSRLETKVSSERQEFKIIGHANVQRYRGDLGLNSFNAVNAFLGALDDVKVHSLGIGLQEHTRIADSLHCFIEQGIETSDSDTLGPVNGACVYFRQV